MVGSDGWSLKIVYICAALVTPDVNGIFESFYSLLSTKLGYCYMATI